REHEGGQGQLGDVELLEADHPEEGLFRGEGGHREVDALDPDPPVRERAGAVVVAPSERDRESCHRLRPCRGEPTPRWGSQPVNRYVDTYWGTVHTGILRRKTLYGDDAGGGGRPGLSQYSWTCSATLRRACSRTPIRGGPADVHP